MNNHDTYRTLLYAEECQGTLRVFDCSFQNNECWSNYILWSISGTIEAENLYVDKEFSINREGVTYKSTLISKTTYELTHYGTRACRADNPYPLRSATFAPTPTAEQTPYTTPYITPLETPVTTPLTTPLTTPYVTPFETPITTPLTTPFSTPLITPLTTPFATSSSLPSEIIQPSDIPSDNQEPTSIIETSEESSEWESTSTIETSEESSEWESSNANSPSNNNADDGEVNPEKESSNSTLFIIIGCVAAALVIIICIIVFIILKKKRNQESNCEESSNIDMNIESVISTTASTLDNQNVYETVTLFATEENDSDPFVDDFEEHNEIVNYFVD